MRWGVTSNLTLNGTVNPDFSQIEADASQFTFDPRSAIFFPEKRPFFLDGLEQFTDAQPAHLHAPHRRSRRRRQAVGQDRRHVAWPLLSAVDADEQSARRRGTTRSTTSCACSATCSAQSKVGARRTRTSVDGPDSQPRGGRGRALRLGRHLERAGCRPAVSRTRERRRDPDGAAPAGRASSATAGASASSWRGTSLDEDFRAESGFIARPRVTNVTLDQRWTFFGGERIEAREPVRATSCSTAIWSHARPRGRRRPAGAQAAPQQQRGPARRLARGRLGPDRALRLRPRRSTPTTRCWPPDGRRPALHRHALHPQPRLGALLEHARSSRASRARSMRCGAATRTSSNGRRPTSTTSTSPRTTGRPTSCAWRGGTSSSASTGAATARTVGVRHIPRLKVEYQLTRAAFLRVVGEYDVDRQDDLRDDGRTELPIVIRDPATGVYEPALALRATSGCAWTSCSRTSPCPGTVIFAGYGSRLARSRGPRFRRPAAARATASS